MTPAELPRVLLIGVGLELAGPARFVTGLATHLDPARFDVAVLVIRDGPLRADLAGTPVSLVVTSPHLTEDTHRARLGFVPFFRIVAHIRRTRPDIVHTNLFGLDLIGRVAALVCRVPVIVSTQHDINPRPWYVNAYRRATVGLIDATVACADAVATYCRDVMRVPAGKLRVIENGIDLARFANVRPPSAGARLLTMGSLSAPKGHITLVEAFAIVRAARPDATLVIAGEGPLESRIRESIAARGLRDCVRIIPPSADVAGLLEDSDVLVQPSLREGLPQAVLEAMAAGRPVVATAVSSLPQVLEGGRCGVLALPGDPARLAAAILSVLADPEGTASMVDAASHRVAEHYSAEGMARAYEDLYKELLGPESDGRPAT